ncbi:hypothetical protein Taro_022512 [Colocasia esculenta]|uniref:Pentatricopeptide repeat-containing protein n=1 Tax=Colocasia esculenta TaxID=4460 RepID=A0A843VEN9_COLES|nr:hypothetical protein [Colocasia esculenta]
MPGSPMSCSAMCAASHGLGTQRGTGGRSLRSPSAPCFRQPLAFSPNLRGSIGSFPASEGSLPVVAVQLERGGHAVQPPVLGTRGCLTPAAGSNLTLECEEVEEDDMVVESGLDQMLSLSVAKVHFLEETDEGVLSKRVLNLSRSNKVRSALELFASMAAAGLRPDSHACNSLLACLVRNGSMTDALKVFEMMRKRDMATGHSFSLILKAVAQARGCNFAIGLFVEVEAEGTEKKILDVVVYNTMISICARAKNWLEAERMWRRLKESACNGTMVTYCLLVSTFVQCGQVELALSAFSEMIQNGWQPDEDTMKAIIAVCTKDGKWASGLAVFRRMLDSGIQPNVIAYNAMINCLGKAGECDRVFEIYELMRSSGHSPDVYTWKALLSALYRSRKYADTLRLFESLTRENFELNVHLYNIALMSCQRLRLWERSLQLLWKMEESGMLVPTASYNLVIYACEHAKQPRVALQVYQRMVHKKCIPDTFTYLSLIRACIWGSLWNEVEDILKSVSPNASLYNALIHGFCLRGKITWAKKLYGKMRQSGLKPDGKTRALMLQHWTNESGR